MDIQTAIAILETKKLTCCNQKEFIQAADMAIAALQQQVPKSMNVSFQNNTNAAFALKCRSLISPWKQRRQLTASRWPAIRSAPCFPPV